jgi:hypothetical protein
MPASFTIDVARRTVFSRAWGILVDDDLRQTQQGVRVAPDFDPDFSQLYDFSAITDVQVTTDALWGMVGDSPFGVHALRAVVVNSDVAFGVARMYQQMSSRESATFRIFRDRESAVRWLEDKHAE